jgi:hypothetical protein
MSALGDLYNQLFGRSAMANGSVIEMSEHGRAGGVSTGQPFKFSDSVPYELKITTSGSDTYVGLAVPGTSQASALWQAFKYSGGVLTYADRDTNFDNVATDLTALSY